MILQRFNRSALYLACRLSYASIAIRHRFGGPVGRCVAGFLLDRSVTIYNAWYARESAVYRARLEDDE